MSGYGRREDVFFINVTKILGRMAGNFFRGVITKFRGQNLKCRQNF